MDDVSQLQMEAHPLVVVMDTKAILSKLHPLFSVENNLDFAMTQITEVISDRLTSDRRLGKASGGIYDELYDMLAHSDPNFSRVMLLEPMISFEQAALDLKFECERLGLYVQNRYLPYRYDKILPDQSLVLRRMVDFDDFSEEFLTTFEDKTLKMS